MCVRVRIVFRCVRDTSCFYSDHLFILSVLSPKKRHDTGSLVHLIPSFPSALTFLFSVVFYSPVLPFVTHFVSSCVFDREWGKDTDKRKDRKRVSIYWRQWRKSLRCAEHKIKHDPFSFLQRKISVFVWMFFPRWELVVFSFASGSINLSIPHCVSLILVPTLSSSLSFLSTAKPTWEKDLSRVSIHLSIFPHYPCISILTSFLSAVYDKSPLCLRFQMWWSELRPCVSCIKCANQCSCRAKGWSAIGPWRESCLNISL